MALGVEGQVFAQLCTYQPVKTSREWCTVERVDSGFRSETASNGWISARQRMAGAELQTCGRKAVGIVRRWSIRP